MSKDTHQGRKTHEQQIRTLERKPDMPDARQTAAEKKSIAEDAHAHPVKRRARQSEFPVSRGGLNQEDRNHNKHNDPGQSGHKPQRHGPAEEKH